jgi:DNA polymerase III delta subunit
MGTGQLIVALGSKENAMEDIHLLAAKAISNPRVLVLSGQGTKETVIETASALFIDEGVVIALVDPPEKLIKEIEKSLSILIERVSVIVYSTSPEYVLPSTLPSTRVALQQEKEKRLKDRVLAAVKIEGKKMTDKAFALLRERVSDEVMLGEELKKLVNYVGDKAVIEAKDVAAVVTDFSEEDFISLGDAMARRDKKQLLEIVEALLSQGTNILAIHAFMARHTRLLLQAKDGESAAHSGSDFRVFSKGFPNLKESLVFPPSEKKHYLAYQKPFYAYNLCKASEKLTRKTLLSFFDRLVEFDLLTKKGTKHDRANFEAGLLGR